MAGPSRRISCTPDGRDQERLQWEALGGLASSLCAFWAAVSRDGGWTRGALELDERLPSMRRWMDRRIEKGQGLARFRRVCELRVREGSLSLRTAVSPECDHESDATGKRKKRKNLCLRSSASCSGHFFLLCPVRETAAGGPARESS